MSAATAHSLFMHLSTLSEPLRVRLLRLLERQELAVGELARVLQTSQPTVSRHLKQLDAGGWVQRRKVGTATLFRAAGDELEPRSLELWRAVRAQVEAEAADPASLYAEDLRRLDSVVAQRSGDSETLFRRLGSRWDAVRLELFGDAYVLPALLALLPPGLVVADLGCGTGAMLPLVAPVAGQVIGVDRELAMLEVARARVAGLENVRLEQGLLGELPLATGSVDVALCELVLHHVASLAPVFAEVARVLRPDGRLVVLDMVEHDREEYRTTMGHQHLGFPEAALCDLAHGAGLALQRWTILPSDPQAQGPGLFVAVLACGGPTRQDGRTPSA